ncbi:unnamed protein product [Spirodela intermedia]|uniref:Uncharacterized protein n=2 Tax=Spirodela intermedia TaxID=51605 RepID=A0A7I8JE93_SPIIN|nr:unnamed protein product [Spirodela intermedia]CAA6668474.1 unnamed protein product [Spirodela intermedia]CAA7405332.1 unnamed protein product [Spirodela intermedia]
MEGEDDNSGAKLRGGGGGGGEDAGADIGEGDENGVMVMGGVENEEAAEELPQVLPSEDLLLKDHLQH